MVILQCAKQDHNLPNNFLDVPDFKIVDNPGFKTVEEGIIAAKSSNPEIIVICSSDDEYANIVEPIYNALKRMQLLL